MRKLKNLLLGAGLALAVLLAPPAWTARADSGGTATITVVAPGAAIGQPVEVQWGDPLGGWHTVDGWKGSLDHLTPQGETFTRWTVFSANFGQHPFRWVIYNPDGQTLWAVGPWFALPSVIGQDYAQRLDRLEGVPGVPVALAPTAPTASVGAPLAAGTPVPSVPAGSPPMLRAHSFTFGSSCSSCGDSQITALIGGLPATSWIGVEWQDGLGQWHAVDGWQGLPDSVDGLGRLLQQWNTGPENFGRGPFRWAVYTSQGGSLVGVSPSFNLPSTSRLNLITEMSPY